MKSLLGRLRKVESGHLARNIGALYAARLINQIVPLAAVPYLARVLGPDAYGQLAMAQAFALFGIVCIQYGLDLSAARAVARCERTAHRQLGEIVAGVLGAQALLVVFVVAIATTLQLGLADGDWRATLLWAAVAYAILQALVPGWYLLGRERMLLVAGLESGARFAGLIGIFVLVHAPADAWRVLAIYAAASGVSACLAFRLVFLEVGAIRLRLRLALKTLREGSHVGMVRIVATGCGAASTLLLGHLLAPRQVAFFAGAEKLCSALAQLFDPVNRALLPRLSHLQQAAPDAGAALATRALIAMLALATLLAGVVFLTAPWLIGLLLGPGYEPAVEVARVMAFAIPLFVANAALVSQWLIPNGLDRPLARLVIGGAVLQLLLTWWIVPVFGAIGLACLVVLTQVLVVGGFLVVLRRRGLLVASQALFRP